jgi:hypothetical protein
MIFRTARVRLNSDGETGYKAGQITLYKNLTDQRRLRTRATSVVGTAANGLNFD